MKILMVCLGNICRSPLAQGILQHRAEKAGLHWHIAGAGTYDLEPGQPPHPLSQKVALLHGISISGLRSRRFVPEDFARYDKVYAMAGDVLEEIREIAGPLYDAAKTDLLLNELYPGRNLDIPDPYFDAEPGFHKTFAVIDRACEKIISRYS